MDIEFKAYLEKMQSLNSGISLFAWDMRTLMPKKGVDSHARVIGYLSEELFKLTTSEDMERFLDYYGDEEHFKKADPLIKAAYREARENFHRIKKIPRDKYTEFVMLTNKAEVMWADARKNSDFNAFKPYLEKIVAFLKEMSEYIGYKENKYDVHLHKFEPGMTVRQLDALFGSLKDKHIGLLRRIRASGKNTDKNLLLGNYSIAAQQEFSQYILDQMGFDKEAGRLDVSAHPFSCSITHGDVRITTNYNEKDFTGALFGTIHECGHALYEQNFSAELAGTNLHDGASFGIHESQSRFWENMVGRSEAFWKRYYPELKKRFPDSLKKVDLWSFYCAINHVEPSLIRIYADEMTYDLHIMIRYEVEKSLLNGNCTVGELPELWNAKYKEYLGVTPPNDAQGVLQDIHWSGGDFGYFPSYSLGNLYAAQLLNSIKKDLPDFEGLIEKGQLLPIKSWMTDKIHRYGKMLTPEELMLSATGEALNSSYYTDYLTSKYSRIYGI